MTTHALRLAFLIPGTYDQPGQSAAAALEDSIRLFRIGEDLGYDLATHRVRHFERALTGVFPFLGAVARETSRIRIGTATVPIANEHPIRLAEDAATVDLLSGRRLELGIGAGHGGRLLPASFAAAYEQDGPIGTPRTDLVLRRFLDAIEGAQLGPVVSGEFALQFARVDEGLRVHPRVEGFRRRLWYGTGSRTSTVRAGELGLGIQLANFGRELDGRVVVGDAGPSQALEIEAYIDAWEQHADAHGRAARGRVAVSRVVVPVPEGRRPHWIDRAVPDAQAFARGGGIFGSVAEVVDRLGSDAALARAREYNEATLLFIVPFYLGADETEELLATLATEVAPQLGWSAEG
ncbi:LLM class flavin-dependent oxidoreductase [Microbacterium allomyrinae]|uniref:LLM class flavin-dependent oxidoreductase n=1 Tax=Microbacterium allomyrinae TaxID=2830666 RepID=A0A9X1LV66_9MICO|nr:LLM class flavin-dependent oxidoreductase [Microbacterium allomyrinae]MCC2032620.1 LLM class flavin-dependent oxidoreductase [Microbacterium allomyrinae]